MSTLLTYRRRQGLRGRLLRHEQRRVVVRPPAGRCEHMRVQEQCTDCAVLDMEPMELARMLKRRSQHGV